MNKITLICPRGSIAFFLRVSQNTIESLAIFQEQSKLWAIDYTLKNLLSISNERLIFIITFQFPLQQTHHVPHSLLINIVKSPKLINVLLYVQQQFIPLVGWLCGIRMFSIWKLCKHSANQCVSACAVSDLYGNNANIHINPSAHAHVRSTKPNNLWR